MHTLRTSVLNAVHPLDEQTRLTAKLTVSLILCSIFNGELL